MRSLGEWSSLRAFAGLMAVACAVASAVAIGRPGGAPVVTLALSLGAVVALVWLRGVVGDVIAGVLVIAAAVAGAHELIAPGPYDFDETVLGTAVPQAVTHLAWWAACFAALALVLAVVLRGRVAGKAVLGAVGAVVLVAALTPGAIAVADGVGRSLLAEAAPRTTAPDDLVPVPETTLPDDLRTAWSEDGGSDPYESQAGRVIPEYGLAVLLNETSLRAVDARTGAERWRYGIESTQAHVSPAHRRVLVSDGGAGVVLDLVTGATVGVIAFPPAEEHVPWQGMGQERVLLAGRTAVLSTSTIRDSRESLLGVDLVGLTAARVGEPEECFHRNAEGLADHVVVVRSGYDCPHQALLHISGDRLTHVTEIDGEITDAHVVGGGVVVEVKERRFVVVALHRDGVAEPVVLGRAESYEQPVVLVLTGPDRVVVAGPSPERVYDLETDRMVEVRRSGRVFDAASGRLVGRAELAGDDAFGYFSQVGDRVVQVSVETEDRGSLRVLDATSLAEVSSVEVPCFPMGVSASAAGVLVRCVNPRRLVVFGP